MSVSGPGYLRGTIGGEIDAAVAYQLGSSLAARLGGGEKLVVGIDRSRAASVLAPALIQGAIKVGADVVDLGCVAAPLVGYAHDRIAAAGAVMIDRSALPPEWVGIRWTSPGPSATAEELLGCDDRRRSISQGEGGDRLRLVGQSSRGRALDVTFDYVAHLQLRFVDFLNVRVNAVIGTQQRCWNDVARRYLQAVFPMAMFHPVFFDAAESEPGDDSDTSSRPSTKLEQAVVDQVYRSRADIGLIFTGHLDQLFVVDDDSVPLGPDEQVWLFLNAHAAHLRGETIVLDDRISLCLDRLASEWNCTFVRHTGDPMTIGQTVRWKNALFGFDFEGRVYFREAQARNDALLAACRWISIVGEQVASIAGLRLESPTVVALPEIVIPYSDRSVAEIGAAIRKRWTERSAPQLDIGWGIGLRVGNSRCRIQPSVYSESLSFRFESDSRDRARWLAGLVGRCLPDELGDQLLSRLEALT